jgi:hypothetical protein
MLTWIGDDDLDSAILLTSNCRIVGGYGIRLAIAVSNDPI